MDDSHDGTADSSGKRRVFTAAELHQIKVDLLEHALDFVDRLSGEDSNQQRLIGRLAFSPDGFGRCFCDFDAWP